MVSRKPWISVESPGYKWAVSAAVMFGTLIVVLNSTGVNIALPWMMAEFKATPDQIQWVVTAYTLSMAVLMPTLGRFSDLLGYKRLFIVCLLLFSLSSGLCAIAWDIYSLIAFRALQGLGAGIIMPLAMAVLFEVFPAEKRGFAMGVYGLGVSLGPVMGPILAGYLTEYLSWQAVFYSNIPLSLLSALGIAWMMPEVGQRKAFSLDGWGLMTLTAFLTSLLLALSQGGRWGWTSPAIGSLLAIAVLSLALFLWVELRSRQPLVDLSLYRDTNFLVGSLIGGFFGLSLMSSIFLISLFVQNVLGYTPSEAGHVMAPGALIMGVIMLLSGKISDRIDPKPPIVIGLLLLAANSYWMSLVNLHTSFMTILLMIVFRHFSLAVVWSPLMAISMQTLTRERMGMGTGLLNVVRQGLGGSIGVALAAVFLVSRQQTHILTRLSETHAPPLSAQALSSLIDHLGKNGHGAQAAGVHALTSVPSEALQQATVLAYQDCFIAITWLALLAITPILMLRRK
ncbi:MAG: multidrug efflux MFS transporter [Candidatus Tectomicrobia bacterium]|uniref:Multidrug efflux MFS transporter n=1 Tax=Tectimicrobiota bacterium TaxID=2528274 RepID=A0A932CQ47_UNCTE|nr:multidrug efflux MFS transporter [Candidatus Tectomicrobia bacterium]